jgi:hypothetical protein
MPAVIAAARVIGFASEVGRAVWSVNPNLPLAGVRTLEEVVRASMARTSFTLVMLAIAGAMALLLGVAGIYGVISYSVSQRTREIGIRMALGAQSSGLQQMFVRQGLLLAGIGAVIGLGAAAGLTRLMSSLLFGVKALDPLTYAGVATILIAAAALASTCLRCRDRRAPDGVARGLNPARHAGRTAGPRSDGNDMLEGVAAWNIDRRGSPTTFATHDKASPPILPLHRRRHPDIGDAASGSGRQSGHRRAGSLGQGRTTIDRTRACRR